MNELTETAELLLFTLCDPDARDLDALDSKLWADELLLLIDHGFAEFAGTLEKATLQATDKGRERYKRICDSDLGRAAGLARPRA